MDESAVKNKNTLIEIQITEDNSDLKLDELDVNSMPFIYVNTECEVVTAECENDAEEKEKKSKFEKDTEHENSPTLKERNSKINEDQ